jgi:hypothetical protein
LTAGRDWPRSCAGGGPPWAGRWDRWREQAQVSVGMLSLIETGRRRPSLRSWERIRGALGISEPLPDEAWRTERREVSDQLVATLGACLAAVRAATLAELAEATGMPIAEVRQVLAIVIMDGMATRRRIEEVRGAATLSIGPDGPVSLPRDSSETLALLVSRGLLSAERDDHATGRPLVYRPTPTLLQLLGAETLEEARGSMGTAAEHRS